MRMIKGTSLSLIVLIFLVCGCTTTTTYHLEISPRIELMRAEIPTGRTIIETTPSGANYSLEQGAYDTDGFGGQISLVETTDYLFARIGYFNTQFSEKEFTYYADGVNPAPNDIKIAAHGFELAVGFRLGWLRPYISTNYLKYKTTLSVEAPLLARNFDDINLLGFGLALDVPLGETTDLFVNAQFRNETQIYSVGLMFRLGTIEYSSSGRE